jgi:hypothetical protein
MIDINVGAHICLRRKPMLRLPRLLLVALTVGSVSLLPAPAQDDKARTDKVRFQTVDGVDLHGTFYPSSKSNPPTVLLLHAIGENSKKKGWVHLAAELQKKGFAVLAFDFRGHGQSTEIIEPQKFWESPANRMYMKHLGKNTSLDIKDITAGYAPILCNDIAAARAFLDRKNDTGGCNTSNLIVIGADTGASLGAIWLYGEWHRHRCKPPPANFIPGMPFPLYVDSAIPEGNDIIACVWISPNPKLSGGKQPARNVNLAGLLTIPGKNKATPMVFMYSEEDKAGKKFAQELEKAMVGKAAKEEKYRFTASVEVPKTKLTGSELLQKSLSTAEQITEYLQGVVEAKGNEWYERAFLKTPYAWKAVNNTLHAANKIGEKNLHFKDYNAYLSK